MPDLKLFVSPGSCARVATVALEEIGVPFETELVYLGTAEQKSPEYLAINPKGKVPALMIDGVPLSENVAILTWLHRTFPQAKLFPAASDDLSMVQQIGDIAYFSGTVHPLVTRIAMPARFVDDPALAMEAVRPSGIKAINPVLARIDARLEGGQWWYGDQWSIMDVYVFWVWWRIGVVGFPGDDFPNIKDHVAQLQERPSVARAMEREAVYVEQLKSEGVYKAPK